MPLIVAERNQMLNTEVTRLAYVSLHTADPGTTGASEVTGGSPAYARKAPSWGAASGGAIAAAQLVFDAPGGTYTHIGYWSASTGGTFLGGQTLAQSQTLSSQGQVQVTPSFTQAAT